MDGYYQSLKQFNEKKRRENVEDPLLLAWQKYHLLNLSPDKKVVTTPVEKTGNIFDDTVRKYENRRRR